MNCQEFWEQMPELEAEGAVLEHAQNCPSCARLLSEQKSLSAALKKLAAEWDRVLAPPRVEARLLREFRAQGGEVAAAERKRGWMRRLAWIPAAAAVVVLGMVLVRGRQPAPTPLPLVASNSAVLDQEADAAAAASDFVPLPSADDPVVTEDADLVRVEVPPSVLVALGVPVPDEGNEGRVQAVMALGKDGVVEAVRVLQ